MQPKITRIEYLRQTIAALDDDPSLPWDTYPCLEWPYSKDSRGRGRLWYEGNTRLAIHVAFVIANGPVPPKHYIERHCFSHSCFRPHHAYAAMDQLEYIKKQVADTKNEDGDWRDYPCLLWPFILNGHGYGYLMTIDGWERVHRVTYRLGREDFDESLHVLHHCDTPSCHRLIHLFQGDQNDNNQDKISKGRQPRGENHCRAKITEKDVVEIFKMSRSGMSQPAIARHFGFKSSVSILKILHRQDWTHVKIDET